MSQSTLPARRWRAFATLAVATAYWAICSGLSAASGPPNICIILVDDMGYGDPACFNPQSKIATPHIDSLARQGMRFTDAHAPGPLCHMSRYGLITGRYPFRTDVTRWPTRPLIEPGQETIATLAKREGYRTAMVGKWHLGFHEQGYDKPLTGGPIDCGFDRFFGMRASTDIPPYFYIRGDRAVTPPTEQIASSDSQEWSPIQGVFWRAGGIAPDLELKDVLPRFTDEAVEVIKQHDQRSTNEPLMLYLAYPAPHTPWLPSKEFAGKSGAGLYGDFVSMVDAQIGRVLTALDESKMADDTLLIFTSDNGPVWREADVEKFGHRSTGGLRGMKADAWEGGHRMPMIVRWPGRVEKGSTSDQLVCFTDFLATFASVMGSQLPEDAGPDSVSFLPALLSSEADEPSVREQFVMQAGSRPSMMTIRRGDWKLVTQLGSGGFSDPQRVDPEPGGPEGQLYNLADDLGETNNVYLQYPALVSRLKAHLAEAVATQGNAKANTETRNDAVDCSTLKGKVMCGYQGWFNTPGDGMDFGWRHWARRPRESFGPGNVTVDLWPDLSGFPADERYETQFKHADGRAAEVYSSIDPSTIMRHFQWMQEYGIDGVFLQRFASELRPGTMRDNRDKVLAGVRAGATQTGRAYAVMYDLSGVSSEGVNRVLEDWRRLQKTQRITADEAYLHHEGRPLVAVWGVGFSDHGKPRDYSLAACRNLIVQLKREGCSVMLGVPTGWRDLNRDSVSDPELHELLVLADVISPWTVGRYRDRQGIARHAQDYWSPDIEWCKDRDLEYLPVVFPGFSWHNLTGSELGDIPREKGRFLWSQFAAAKRVGAEMIYVAMFDEVDEGTAIFKCTDDPPAGDGVKFLTYEGLPSDHYLWLTGEAGRVLRNERPASDVLPRRGK